MRGLPWLRSFLDGLPKSCWPRLLGGDVGYGNEEIMADAEERAMRYLFKVKRSRNVCALFRRMEFSGPWKDCGSGWQCVDTFIRLDGWTTTRRCLLVRRPSEQKPKAEPARRPRGRPSYNYHTFFIGAARVTLGVDVTPGRQHSGRCGMPWLRSFLDGLPKSCWPRLSKTDGISE